MGDTLTLVLERFLTCEHGVFGTLDLSGYVFFTGEDEWRDNQPGISCIPVGTYRIKRVNSPKFGATYEICDVPGRSHILFHAGNTEEDTRGCVLVGLALGVKRVERDEESERPAKKLAVTQSRLAFERFMERMRGAEEAVIEVNWAEG